VKVAWLAWEMRYRWRVIRNEVDGMATKAPPINLVATRYVSVVAGENKYGHIQVSHQIGAQLTVLLFQTIELTNALRQERPIHVMCRIK